MVGTMDFEDGVAASVAYLASGAAMEALAMSPYRQVELEQSSVGLCLKLRFFW